MTSDHQPRRDELEPKLPVKPGDQAASPASSEILPGGSQPDLPAPPEGSAEMGKPAPTVNFGSFLRYFLWLGVFGFGGPIATVGYMQRDLVEQRGWLDKQDMLDGIALGQTMPGPLAAQVSMWVGYLRKGALRANMLDAERLAQRTWCGAPVARPLQCHSG